MAGSLAEACYPIPTDLEDRAWAKLTPICRRWRAEPMNFRITHGKKVRLKNLTFLLPIQLQSHAHLVDGDGPVHLRLARKETQ